MQDTFLIVKMKLDASMQEQTVEFNKKSYEQKNNVDLHEKFVQLDKNDIVLCYKVVLKTLKSFSVPG